VVSLRNIIQCTGKYENLVCPICGFEYVHPIAVRVTRAKEMTEITSKGIFIRDAINPGRGVIIEMVYACENGHRGVIILTFHRGITYVEHRKLSKSRYKWKTIWRV